jgi:hypothetical protein
MVDELTPKGPNVCTADKPITSHYF